MRSLVRKGVKAERLERAARNPVVNALLRAMNVVIGSHTARLERRLSLEFPTLCRLTATVIVLAHAVMRILEHTSPQSRGWPTGRSSDAKKHTYNTLCQRLISETERIMEGMLDERNDAL